MGAGPAAAFPAVTPANTFWTLRSEWQAWKDLS
jgi:hypothetical protein